MIKYYVNIANIFYFLNF